jgi:hypothetical protein
MTSLPSEQYQPSKKKKKRNRTSFQCHLDYSKFFSTSMNNINETEEIISTQSQRELGIIEKLCSTYGFVYCCHRDGRYFFHFSEYKNDIQQAKIGGRD